MTAERPASPVTEGVRSLEVRWIFPGQLEAAVAGWFGRFPAAVESREDAYLLDPQLRGLSVKIRAGGALEVKMYHGSPGILEVAGRARGRMESWQKWSFPLSPPSQDSAGPPAGGRYARGGGSAGSHGPAGRSRPALWGGASTRGARWNSPRSARLVRTGGPWASRRPAPPICSAANLRPPLRSCSPRPCRVGWSPARMTPGPMRDGCASVRAPRVTLTPEGCPCAGPAGSPVCPPRPAPARRGTPEATLPPPITSSRQAGARSAWPKPSTVGQLAGWGRTTGRSGCPRRSYALGWLSRRVGVPRALP